MPDADAKSSKHDSTSHSAVNDSSRLPRLTHPLQTTTPTSSSTSSNIPDLKTKLKILEEGFWDSLTIPKKQESSGTCISDELSSSFFRHLHLIDDDDDDTQKEKELNPNHDSESSKSQKTSFPSVSRESKPNLVSRVSPYLSKEVQFLYPNGIRTQDKSQALDLFKQVEPWSKFFIKDLRVEIFGGEDRKQKEKEKSKETANVEEEEEGNKVGLLTYKVKARTEDVFYEALCSTTWAFIWDEEEASRKEKRSRTGRGSWKMISHQQSPVK